MFSLSPSAVRRALTLLWCLVIGSVLGLGSGGATAGALTLDGSVDVVRASANPDALVGQEPSGAAIGEDASESFEGDDDDAIHMDSRAPLASSSAQVVVARATRREGGSSHAIERRRHNRGPPIG